MPATLAAAGGRAAVGRSFNDGFTRSVKLKITSLTVSRPTSLGIGVLRFGITFKTRLGRFHVAYAFVRVRAVGQILLLGRPGKIVAAGDVKRLGIAQRDRFRKGFTITRGEVILAGTPTQGSTLTATRRRRRRTEGQGDRDRPERRRLAYRRVGDDLVA